MGTLLASQSLAAGATVTSAAFPFSVFDDITATVLNSAPPPTQPVMVTLMLSADNTNYIAVDRRLAGVTPSQAYYHIFPLSNYAGFSPGVPGWDFLTGAAVLTGSATGLTAGAINTVQSAKLKFENLGASGAVTVAANDGCSQNLAVVHLAGVTATTGGAVAAWAPPGGGRCLVSRVIADITTNSTGAANLSIGTAANATTSSTNMIIATAVGSAAVVLDSVAGGSAGASVGTQALASGSYVTVTGSATTVGLVGNLYVYYTKP